MIGAKPIIGLLAFLALSFAISSAQAGGYDPFAGDDQDCDRSADHDLSYQEDQGWSDEAIDITGEVDTNSMTGGVEAPMYPSGSGGRWLVSITPDQAPNAFEQHRAQAYAYLARQRAR